MKAKAIIKGNMLLLKDPVKFKHTEIEVDISDNDLQLEEKSKGQSFSESIWETIGKFPEVHVDWEKEWHKHLEGKYSG